jgi:large repetitive protein
MLRIRAAVLPAIALAFTATCSSPPPVSVDPDPSKVQPTVDLTAVSLGVTIDSRDERGAPRLIRAIVPRQAARGMTADEAARDHLAALKPLWLAHQRASDLATHSTQRLRSGASVVRLKQRIDNIEIHQSELRVLVGDDGSLGAVSGTMRASGGRTTFRSTATAALERALDVLYGKTRARPAITEGSEVAGYRQLTVAETPEFRVTTARAKRELMPDGDQTFPIWSLEVFSERPGFDGNVDAVARRFLIADGDGRVVRDVNLIASDAFVYRAFADTTGVRIPLDGALDSFNPHPTGTPDGSLPGPAPYNLVVMDSFNGPRDPWLANDATTTSGNNVDAFADIAPPSGFGPGDIRPDVRAGRTLNHRYDFNAEPLANETQSKAAAVNLFFVQNWLHDWYYDSGFTEATGNAQVDNFGRGGVGGDPIIAHAQADALGGSRDNANMATPEDGLSPITNMFLFSGKATTHLATPTTTPNTVGFATGPRNFDLTGEVALATNTADGTHTACGPVNADVSGKIALFEFTGLCGSAAAVNNVKAAGAIGVIGIIAIPGAPAQGLNGSAAANIPGVIVGNDDGLALEAALPVTVTITGTTSRETDGDFDNQIIAHEWGHYLHLRLASCEATNQCGAMSEGWGDFNALMMMLRETDNREGTFGAGLYALTAGGLQSSGFVDPGYFGVRRFPYSLNRTKNGLSFRHISDTAALPDIPTNPGPAGNPNSESHNAGEVWAQMLWEAYNVVIDNRGFTEGHRRMTDYVVAGLLLTPPEATFTEGRDAILAAAGALDTDDMILMAAAFAGRGAGTCAVSPPRTSFDFTGVVESGTVAAKLETSSVTVTDDGVSCDHDGILDPGESGTLRITVANGGVLAAVGVVVTATTTTPGVTLGQKIEVGNLAALTHVDLSIPIKLSATAAVSSTLDIKVNVQGDAGCNGGKLAIELHAPMGADEQAAISASDNLETKIVAWTPAGMFGGDLWGRATDAQGNHVLLGLNAPFTSDTQLVSPVFQASATDPLVVTLKHAFNLESLAGTDIFFDGGVLEVSSDGGATWKDVTEVGVDPGYTGTISVDFDNPLAGRPAFSGSNASFPDRDALSLDFGTQFAGQAVQLRFRLGTDFNSASSGWEIDDIAVTGITNTPFPGFVPEPTTCVNGTATRTVDESGVIGVHRMPHHSLSGVPGANASL